LVSSSCHTGPFPFMGEEMCRSLPIVPSAFFRRAMSSAQSGCSAISSPRFLSKEETTAAHRVSHTVGRAIPSSSWWGTRTRAATALSLHTVKTLISHLLNSTA
jgi:hypothetical protein